MLQPLNRQFETDDMRVIVKTMPPRYYKEEAARLRKETKTVK